MKSVLAPALAAAIAYEQVAGHAKDHIPEAGGAPPPREVFQLNVRAITSGQMHSPPLSSVIVCQADFPMELLSGQIWHR
jgi:hypothetical protein